jgi:riboflavin biosynthesis pyrimidine reductase
MLALLRACADAVIVGAGTLREYPRARWTPEETAPDLAAELASLRSALAKPPRPLVVFVSRSGNVDLGLPVFASGDPVLLMTTREGAARLGNAPASVRVHATDRAPNAREIVETVAHETNGRLLLTEGGPMVLGQFLRDRMLDEIFLTLAPQIAGRSAEERRIGLVEGIAFDPDQAPRAELLSVRRADDHLFFRYRLRR